MGLAPPYFLGLCFLWVLWVPDVLVFFSGLGFGGVRVGVGGVSNAALASA